MYSDDGTNFQGASNELHEIYNMLHISSQMTRIQDFLTSERCDWKFIPPHAPHFGGFWEAAVKSMLGSHIATLDELSTLLAEIEACLNSIPLCALSDDPFNPTYYVSVSWTFFNW